MKTILTTILLMISLASFGKRYVISFYGNPAMPMAAIDTSGIGDVTLPNWVSTNTWTVSTGDTIEFTCNLPGGAAMGYNFHIYHATNPAIGFLLVNYGAMNYEHVMTVSDYSQVWINEDSQGQTFFTLNVQTSTGIKEPAADLLKVYPNPVAGVLTIEASPTAAVKLYTVNGQLILSQTLTNGPRLDLTWLDQGLYLLWVDERVYRLIKE